MFVAPSICAQCEQFKRALISGGHAHIRASVPRRPSDGAFSAPRQVHAVLGARFLHGEIELVGIAQRSFVAQHLRACAREDVSAGKRRRRHARRATSTAASALLARAARAP
jgi:hypothetical protein